MSKIITGIVVVLAIVGIAYYALNRPEPTPQERLSEAAENARDAAKDAGDALADAASDAGDAVASSATETADDMKDAVAEAVASMSETLSKATQDTQSQLNQLLADWKATGIVSEDGIDMAKATEAIEASDFSASTKAQIIKVLTALNDAPGKFEDNIKALKEMLKT